MSLLPILLWGDARLTEVARPVGGITPEVRRLAEDMAETMYAAPGRGLAAPQVGVGLRLFVMDCDWKETGERLPLVLVDPVIVASSEETAVHEEGCLSIPDVPVQVTRPAAVTMRWRDLEGATVERRFEGMQAVCAQHEYDHLDGILIPDRVQGPARAALEPALRQLAAKGGTA